ncbi:hypothetical protein AG1IA_03363 [Rhizoctonia solani AG-1 IA]|uniref:Uncharacterized protein n=1 Tax=Thanatephorus cucumeris (strain AG1-IA) TaxID=983506 RepID=L8WWX5_THACA|nr:hypothetical protein AG1IA_03363 [Rhizoctonia solani AG-1 IA]
MFILGTTQAQFSLDDAAAYLQALGLEPPTPKGNKPKMRTKAQNSYDDTQIRHPEPARSTTLPTYPPKNLPRGRPDAGPINSHLDILEQYTTGRYNLLRSDYAAMRRTHSNDVLSLVDPSISSRSASPLNTSSAPESPATRSQSSRRDLPPRPPPPSTFAPHAPVPSINAPRARTSSRSLKQDSSSQNSPASLSRPSPLPRSQPSPMSLTVPSAHALRSAASNGGTNSSQLALPLVRVRITCPPQRGALRQLPALILLNASARASFAAATWAQMVTYCARNAGVSIARRGGGGALRVSVEERMAELTTPGGGRGVGDEEVGFGLGYYVSVEMTLEGEIDYQDNEGSVPVASLSIPLPTTLGELAIVFRERKDIRMALS